MPPISPKGIEYTDPSLSSPESRKVELNMNTVSPVLVDEALRRIVQAIHPEQILLFGSKAWVLRRAPVKASSFLDTADRDETDR
jgi:hypothetical protein